MEIARQLAGRMDGMECDRAILLIQLERRQPCRGAGSPLPYLARVRDRHRGPRQRLDHDSECRSGAATCS